jgi:hypothetical protein
MLRAVGGDNEEETFVTLELIAYSTKTARELTTPVVKELRSSRLVCSLIIDLLSKVPGSPDQIVLVNKQEVWRDIFAPYGLCLVPSGPVNKRGMPRAYRLHDAQGATPVPLIILNGAQGMKFPRPSDETSLLFTR